MKKLIFLLCIVLFFSCSKKNTKVDNTTAVLKEVLNLKSAESQRLAFSEILTPEERLQVWSNRLQEILLTQELSNVQRNLIVNLRKKLKTEIFQESKCRDQFKKGFLEQWKTEAVAAFGPTKAHFYFASLKSLNSLNSVGLSTVLTPADDEVSGEKNCNCNKESAFSCVWNTRECLSVACTKTSGCGALFLFACDGRCN